MRHLTFILFLLASVACMGTRCGGPVCSPQQTRCNATEAQLCDPEGYWSTVTDCSEVESVDGAEWVCAPKDETHTCVRYTPELPDTADETGDE